MACFQKTNFGVSSAEGAGNTKIGFIMRIAETHITSKLMNKAISVYTNPNQKSPSLRRGFFISRIL